MHKERGNENLQKIKSPLGSVCGLVSSEFARANSLLTFTLLWNDSQE